MIHKVEAYMSEVRDLALPRLKVEEARLRGWEVPMVFAFRTAANRLRNLLQYGEMGLEMGNTEMTCEGGNIPLCLTIHREDVVASGGVYGEVIAFALIHELAHAASGEGHTEVWAGYCQDMGICEHPYAGQTKRELKVSYAFKDQDFLRQLKRLGTYPGDKAGKEEVDAILTQLDTVEKEMYGILGPTVRVLAPQSRLIH